MDLTEKVQANGKFCIFVDIECQGFLGRFTNIQIEASEVFLNRNLLAPVPAKLLVV